MAHIRNFRCKIGLDTDEPDIAGMVCVCVFVGVWACAYGYVGVEMGGNGPWNKPKDSKNLCCQ